MKYNFEKIGERIKKERIEHGFKSLDSFADRLKDFNVSLTRQTLSNIEKGYTNRCDCKLLFALCEIFDCEMGYLLCEYDAKHKRISDVAVQTGLSVAASDKLCQLENKDLKNVLSMLVEHKDFVDILATINKAKSYSVLNDTFVAATFEHIVNGISGGLSVRLFDNPEDVGKYFTRIAQDMLAAMINELPFKPIGADEQSTSKWKNVTPTKQQLKNMALNGQSIQIGGGEK